MISAFTEQLIWFVIVVPLLLPMIKSQQKIFGTRQIFCMVFLIFFFVCNFYTVTHFLQTNEKNEYDKLCFLSFIYNWHFNRYHLNLALAISLSFRFWFYSVSFLFSQFNSIHIKGKKLNYYKYHRRRFWHRFVRQGLNLTFIF